MMQVLNIIKKYSKYFILANFIILAVFWGYIAFKKVSTGYVFNKDVSIRGGYQIVLPDKGINLNELKNLLESEGINAYVYKTSNLIYIESSTKIDVTQLISKIKEKLGVSYSLKEIEIRQYDSYFGQMIFNEFTKLIIIALILIAIAILLRIRNKIATFTIILTILFDIGFASFVLAITNYPISVISLVALLMALGYAIDNNIVLATNMLKEEGDFDEKVKLSLKVGYLMEATTMIVLAIMYFLINAKVVDELAFVLLLTLIADAYFYLFGNIPIYYELLEKKKEES